MNTAHKIELKLNEDELNYCCQAVGVSRFAYNWALANWKSQYQEYKTDKTKERPTESKLRKKLNSVKESEFPWMYEVSKCIPQKAIINLGEAFENFFQGKSSYPKFKKKYDKDSFYIDNENFKISPCGQYIKIPNLNSWIKMKEKFRFHHLNPKLISLTISRIAHKWFASISAEIPNAQKTITSENQTFVGIDLGISAYATLNNGQNSIKIIGEKPYRTYIKRVKSLSKKLSKKVKGSNNSLKAKLKLSKLHMKIANIRHDFIHKLTTDIVKKYDIIGVETLNINGLVKNHCLAQSIMDQSFSIFKNQLVYKADRSEKYVYFADRWYPSSKICSDCEIKNEQMTLSTRNWTCVCGSIHDRDENAAKNLRNMALQQHRQKSVEKKALA